MTHCSESNPTLWGEYSDTFKDVHGFRPRWFMTEGQVNKDMASLHKEVERQIQEEDERVAREKQEKLFRETFPRNEANNILTYNPFVTL